MVRIANYSTTKLTFSFGIQTNNEELDLPYIYWIPKMHKNEYKHRFIAGSSKCSTKPLSILLTKLLTHIKQGFQKYCETAYSRSGINQMWILKNSKELLDHLKSPNFNLITNIKSFDFSNLYTTITNQKLKSRQVTIIRNSFIHKNGNRRYKYLVLGREGPLFCNGTLWFEEQVHWRRYHQDALVSSWQHFRGLRREVFPTDNRHSHGHKLCPSPSRVHCGFIKVFDQAFVHSTHKIAYTY